jgi:hypothetical protein
VDDHCGQTVTLIQPRPKSYDRWTYMPEKRATEKSFCDDFCGARKFAQHVQGTEAPGLTVFSGRSPN